MRLDKITRLLEQLSACLEHEARQPRLAMEADGPANTKTQERTESAATPVQAMRGDSCTTAQRVQDGPMTNSTCFGMMAEPPACQGWRRSRERRCRARVVSPIYGDAHNNSSRWLSFHRQSLYSYEDHFQRATSSDIRDRGDESRGGLEEGKFMDFNSIRLVRQQRLPGE